MDTEQDAFFKQLNRLYDLKTVTYAGADVGHIDYAENGLTKKEYETLMTILDESEDILLHPIHGPFLFYPAYVVSRVNFGVYPGVPTEAETLARFSDKQLPKGVTFDSLMQYFGSEKNLKLAEHANIDFDMSSSVYYY